jgi:hypothetical protein
VNPEELRSTDVVGMLTGSGEDLTPARFRVSRPCYDKFHRCPGWAGGGLRYARVRRCDNGYIETGHVRLWKWRLYRCPKCRVIVLPYMTRWLDWRWLRYRAERGVSDWKYERQVKVEDRKVTFFGEDYWVYAKIWNFDFVWWKASATTSLSDDTEGNGQA